MAGVLSFNALLLCLGLPKYISIDWSTVNKSGFLRGLLFIILASLTAYFAQLFLLHILTKVQLPDNIKIKSLIQIAINGFAILTIFGLYFVPRKKLLNKK